MKVQLSVLDRLLILNALPAEESIITLRIARELKKELSFSEDELKALNIRDNPKGGLVWENTVKEKEFDLGEKASEMIITALKTLSDKKKLTDAHVDLWDKVVQDRV